MLRFQLYLDKDEETKWLNEMAENGYAMTRFCAGFYHFDSCEPGKYEYQVDFGGRFFSVSQDYREFMAEMGVEIVQSWGPWIIVRRLSKEGPFELYTDVDSGIEHYSRIRKMFYKVLVVELACFFMEVFATANGFWLGLPFTCLIGAAVVGIMNMVIRLNDTIADLKERKGETVRYRGRYISGLIPFGLLLNSCVILFFEDATGVRHGIRLAFQIIAIVTMLAGIIQTCRKKKQGSKI